MIGRTDICPRWPSCGCGAPIDCNWNDRYEARAKMTTKQTNPKDGVGFNKSPMFSYISRPVIAERCRR